MQSNMSQNNKIKENNAKSLLMLCNNNEIATAYLNRY